MGVFRALPNGGLSCSFDRSDPRPGPRFLFVFLGLLRRQFLPQRLGSFFKVLNRLRVLSMMFRPGSQLAIIHGPDFAAQRLLAHRNAKLLPKPLRQIAQTPENDAVEKGCRLMLNGMGQGRTLPIVQARRMTGSLAIDQVLVAAFVKAHDPVPNDLQRDIAETGGIETRATLVDRSECEQTSCLGCVLRLPRQSPQTLAIKSPRNEILDRIAGLRLYQRFRFPTIWEADRVEIEETAYNPLAGADVSTARNSANTSASFEIKN